MNTLFDLNAIPEKQADNKPSPEFVIAFTDVDGAEWLYAGISSYDKDSAVSQFTKRGERRLPKRYKSLQQAQARCKRINNTRVQWAVDSNITARVIVWDKS